MPINSAFLGTIIPAKKIYFKRDLKDDSGISTKRYFNISEMTENPPGSWPLIDYCFNPYYITSVSYPFAARFALDFGENPPEIDGYLLDQKRGVLEYETEWGTNNIFPNFSENGNFSSPFYGPAQSLEQLAGGVTETPINDPEEEEVSRVYSDGLQVFKDNTANRKNRRFIQYYIPATNIPDPSDPSTNYPPVRVSELAALKLVEMPHNQQLLSYTVTPGNPTEKALTTMSGRSIKVMTAPALDSVSLTFTWAEDNVTASKLYEIFSMIKTNGSPLVFIEPLVNGLTVEKRSVRLLSLENDPVIQQTARGVYQVTISGRCLP